MENLTKEQKSYFINLLKTLKMKNSLKQLEQFLDLIENNAIQKFIERYCGI